LIHREPGLHSPPGQRHFDRPRLVSEPANSHSPCSQAGGRWSPRFTPTVSRSGMIGRESRSSHSPYTRSLSYPCRARSSQRRSRDPSRSRGGGRRSWTRGYRPSVPATRREGPCGRTPPHGRGSRRSRRLCASRRLSGVPSSHPGRSSARARGRVLRGSADRSRRRACRSRRWRGRGRSPGCPDGGLEHAGDAVLEQVGVGPELRGEAVGGVDGRALAADGLAESRVLAHEGNGASPRRGAIERLGERHPDPRSEGVAGAASPSRLVELGDQRPDLGGVEESCKLGRRRARWYLRSVHGAAISVGRTPGCWRSAGVVFSACVGTTILSLPEGKTEEIPLSRAEPPRSGRLKIRVAQFDALSVRDRYVDLSLCPKYAARVY
jgi:hypothetical protein